MARLQWIKQRLDNWARWARERESGSLGYPKQSAFMRMTPSGGGFDAAVPTDSLDASLTDSAVQSLRFTHPHVWLTLKLHYVEGFEIRRVAQKMAKAESTTKSHLDQADHLLALWFRARDEAAAARPGAKQGV